LQKEIESLVVRSVSEADSTRIPEFYETHLRYFFDKNRYFWDHLTESNRSIHRLLADLQAQERYFNSDEKAIAKEIETLIEIKDDLDYQFALQSVLKYWLFLHIPLTYVLLLFSVLHGILAHAFSRGF